MYPAFRSLPISLSLFDVFLYCIIDCLPITLMSLILVSCVRIRRVCRPRISYRPSPFVIEMKGRTAIDFCARMPRPSIPKTWRASTPRNRTAAAIAAVIRILRRPPVRVAPPGGRGSASGTRVGKSDPFQDLPDVDDELVKALVPVGWVLFNAFVDDPLQLHRHAGAESCHGLGAVFSIA